MLEVRKYEASFRKQRKDSTKVNTVQEIKEEKPNHDKSDHDNEEWEVEKILAHKFVRGGKRKFKESVNSSRFFSFVTFYRIKFTGALERLA